MANINADDLSFSLTLHSPMTREDWEKIEDLEMESVPAVTFTTPSGKEVEFVKVVQCKYCKHWSDFAPNLKRLTGFDGQCKKYHRDIFMNLTDYCSYAERREEG